MECLILIRRKDVGYDRIGEIIVLIARCGSTGRERPVSLSCKIRWPTSLGKMNQEQLKIINDVKMWLLLPIMLLNGSVQEGEIRLN